MIQDRLTSLNELSGIPKLIEEYSVRSAPELASSSALQFSGMSQCPGTQISVTVNRPKRRIRQQRHSLATLKLFVRQRLYPNLAIRKIEFVVVMLTRYQKGQSFSPLFCY